MARYDDLTNEAFQGRLDRRDLERTVPHFYMKAVVDKHASRKEGRVVRKDVPYCEIQQIGDNKSIFHIRAEEPFQLIYDGLRSSHMASAAELWPQQWEAFQANEGDQIIGTRLADAGYSPSQVENLKSLKILTVEQLANLADNMVKKLGFDGDSLRTKARDYLEATKGAVDVARMRDLEAQVEQLRQQLSAQPGPAPKPDQSDKGDGGLSLLDADGLRAFLKDRGQNPHHASGRDKLLAEAIKVYHEETA